MPPSTHNGTFVNGDFSKVAKTNRRPVDNLERKARLAQRNQRDEDNFRRQDWHLNAEEFDNELADEILNSKEPQ